MIAIIDITGHIIDQERKIKRKQKENCWNIFQVYTDISLESTIIFSMSPEWWCLTIVFFYGLLFVVGNCTCTLENFCHF